MPSSRDLWNVSNTVTLFIKDSIKVRSYVSMLMFGSKMISEPVLLVDRSTPSQSWVSMNLLCVSISTSLTDRRGRGASPLPDYHFLQIHLYVCLDFRKWISHFITFVVRHNIFPIWRVSSSCANYICWIPIFNRWSWHLICLQYLRMW